MKVRHLLFEPNNEGNAGILGKEIVEPMADPIVDNVDLNDPAKLLAKALSDIEAVNKKNRELLALHAADKDKLVKLESARSEAEKKIAEATGNDKVLLEIIKKEKDKVEERANELEEKIKERDSRDEELSKKQLRKEMEAAFKKELKGEISSDKLLRLVSWDKFINESSEKDTYMFNKDGVKQAVEEFLEAIPNPFKIKDNGINSAASNKTNADKAKLTEIQRLEQSGLPY